MHQIAKPKLLVALRPSLYELLFPQRIDQALRALGHVVYHDEELDLTSAELAQRVGGFDAVITGWGSPQFTDEVLAGADRLSLIAHSAGSIKHLLPPAVFERGIAVTHAASAIAPAVAEMSLLLILLVLRHAHKMDQMLREGKPWENAHSLDLGRELSGQRVGVVGAGHTGCRFIKLLHAMEAEVWVYDPYLSNRRATEMGVRKVVLEHLLTSCPIISLQAPVTDETVHLIGAQELGLLQDGTLIVNTARSLLVDQDALLVELQSGRIQAALDVFDQEPLPEDSPFRKLANVVLTPHIAGATLEARHRQGQTVVDEARRFFSGEPLQCQVTREMLETMA